MKFQNLPSHFFGQAGEGERTEGGRKGEKRGIGRKGRGRRNGKERKKRKKSSSFGVTI